MVNGSGLCITINAANDNYQSTPFIRRFEVEVQVQVQTSTQITFSTILEIIEDGMIILFTYTLNVLCSLLLHADSTLEEGKFNTK